MNAREFNERCTALFGRGWNRHLARALGVRHQSVFRWSKGERGVPRYMDSLLAVLEAAPLQYWPARFVRDRRRKRRV